ncbi:sulfite exporter TauE/SafE family protein [Spiroplasma alleghenense]|uniref:Probable membrane transporter protein n=1 Tax=Spiroplasma alleghenense TaxID=216931 RepID=A0A345Z4J3_9MOLU|nr:sulfite exporter TauE/SafE family protein [Spiroplasma alleghenense]AXK51522.1 sulfite exporter TauE/SafE family protein [Spiroplasma alleghenense]
MGLAGLIPILIVLALLVSALGSLSGVGGGVLFVPILLLLLTSKSIEEVKFLSTLLVFTSSLINVCYNLYKKSINYLVILIGLTFSIPMIFLGNYLVTLFDSNILKLIIGITLIFIGILLVLVEYKFKNKLLSTTVEQTNAKKFQFLKISDGNYISTFKVIIIALTGGLITSLTGMGGGPILMPLLLIWCKLSIKNAAPISHALIAGASLVSLITNYQFFQEFDLIVVHGLPMIFGVIIGTISAIWLKKYVKKEIYIKWVLIILIWASAIKMIIDYFF